MSQVIAWENTKTHSSTAIKFKNTTGAQIFTFQPETKIIERLYKIHIICTFNPSFTTTSATHSQLTFCFGSDWHDLQLKLWALDVTVLVCTSFCFCQSIFPLSLSLLTEVVEVVRSCLCLCEVDENGFIVNHVAAMNQFNWQSNKPKMKKKSINKK